TAGGWQVLTLQLAWRATPRDAATIADGREHQIFAAVVDVTVRLRLLEPDLDLAVGDQHFGGVVASDRGVGSQSGGLVVGGEAAVIGDEIRYRVLRVAGQAEALCHLGAHQIALKSRNGDGGDDRYDRHDDHQFDQGKT